MKLLSEIIGFVLLLAFIVLMGANTSSCVGGGGLHWQYDGKQHTFSWGSK